MEKLKSFLMSVWSDEEGATVVEYAVMLALIILVAIATITIVGNRVDEAFKEVSDKLPTPAS